MFYNPFLQMMEMQARFIDQASDMVFTMLESQREMMFTMQARPVDVGFTVSRQLVDTVDMHHAATFSENVFDVSGFWPLQYDTPVERVPRKLVEQAYSDEIAVQAAEDEGMGTAILSAPVQFVSEVAYDAPCNCDANVIAPHAIVQERPQSIKQWFSKESVAAEQDRALEPQENKHVYTPFGSAPNVPSTKAVLERYKAQKSAKNVKARLSA